MQGTDILPDMQPPISGKFVCDCAFVTNTKDIPRKTRTCFDCCSTFSLSSSSLSLFSSLSLLSLLFSLFSSLFSLFSLFLFSLFSSLSHPCLSLSLFLSVCLSLCLCLSVAVSVSVIVIHTTKTARVSVLLRSVQKMCTPPFFLFQIKNFNNRRELSTT